MLLNNIYFDRVERNIFCDFVAEIGGEGGSEVLKKLEYRSMENTIEVEEDK